MRVGSILFEARSFCIRSVFHERHVRAFKKLRSVFLAITGGLILCAGYYCYLNALYLVDEVFEGDTLQELQIQEKTTVFLRQAPANLDHLKKFVLHYSICPSVHEITVIWSKEERGGDPPTRDLFKFTKTHSRVTFIDKVEAAEKELTGSESGIFETEGVLLLDSDVYVSCTDLHFSHGVWRSARDAAVGFFPRLHRRSNLESDPGSAPVVGYELMGWSEILSKGAYSLMLPAGLFLHRKYINIGYADTSVSSSSDMKKKSKKILIGEYLAQKPLCEDIAIPLYSSSMSPVPPVFVDVRVSIKHHALSKQESLRVLNAAQKNKCLTALMNILDIEDLPLATHKSTVAKSHLFW